MTDHDQRVIHSSEDPNWRTPLACYRTLCQEFCFEIDAAADQQSHLCPRFFGPAHGDWLLRDALEVHWDEYANNNAIPPCFFLNPPFSRTLAARLKKAGDPRHEWYRIENWAKKCWDESRRGCTIVAIMPFAPQTDWYTRYVYGHTEGVRGWSGHAALQERRLPHRISFLTAEGKPSGNAGVNSVIVVWGPATGIVGPWCPWQCYWSFR
jgi:hypothetical protein